MGEPTREPGISSVSDISRSLQPGGYFYPDGTWPRPSGLRADSGMRSAEQWRVLVTSLPLPVGLGSLNPGAPETVSLSPGCLTLIHVTQMK